MGGFVPCACEDAQGTRLNRLACRCPIDDMDQTSEGVKHQLQTSSGNSSAVIVSTLAEAWGIVNSGLVKDGVVKDVSSIAPILPLLLADVCR